MRSFNLGGDIVAKRDASKQAAAPAPEAAPTDSRGGKFARAALIALCFATVAILSICDLNSYDTWTHLAAGRLMWEEKRIPDHECFSYTQNRRMSIEEAAPKYTLREHVIGPNGRLVLPAGARFDDAAKAKLEAAGVPLSKARARIEPPLRALLSDAVDASGGVVMRAGTLLRDGEIAALRNAGVTQVETTVPWVNHEWLFQIPAYLSYKWLGMPGPTLFKALIVTAAFFVVFLAAYRKETHVLALAAVFLAAITSYKRFFMRPEVVSIFFTALWILLLERYRRKGGWWICVCLPLLMIVWINSHGYFILGIGILLIYLAGEGLQWIFPMPRFCRRTLLWKDDLLAGKALGRLGIATLLTVAATFVNPYGVDGARYPLDVLAQVYDPTSVVRTVISEMQPTFDRGHLWGVWFTRWLIAASAASWLFNIRRLKFSRVLLWAVSIVFMLKALRNMPFFGVPGAMLMAININEGWDDFAGWARRHTARAARVAVLAASQAGLAALLVTFFFWNLTDRFYIQDLADIRCGLGYSDDKFSMEAVEWVRDHPVEGPMFNSFGSGGLCMWKLYPETRVDADGVARTHYDGRRLYIDGRTEQYGGPFITGYTQALANPRAWEELDRKHRFGVVYLEWQAGDVRLLMRNLYWNPEWALCYGDGAGYVFVRRTEANRALIERARNVLEHPQFVILSGTYSVLAGAMPALPRRAAFNAFEERIQTLAQVTNADPRLGEQARLGSRTPAEIRFDRRLLVNRYDRVRAAVTYVGKENPVRAPEYTGGWSLLPARLVVPEKLLGVAGFALNAGFGDFAEAYYRGFLTYVQPDAADVLVRLGNLCQIRADAIRSRSGDLKPARPDYEAALRYYREALDFNGDYPISSLLLQVYAALGDGQNVNRWLERVADEGTADTLNTVVSLNLQLGRPEEALRRLEHGLAQASEMNSASFHNAIANILYQLRRVGEALPHAERAVDLDSGSSPFHFTLGRVYEALGRRDDAVASYRESIKRDPKSPANQCLQNLLAPPAESPAPRQPAFPSPYGR